LHTTYASGKGSQKYRQINLPVAFIMLYSLIWWFNNRDDRTAYDVMVNYAAVETGYLDRIKEEDRRLKAGVQLTIFDQ
jgi:hypothetical protein